MNLENQLQIQAWIDGELPESDALRIKGLVERDAAARVLADEFKALRAAMAGNETPVKLADTREFYWSQIRGKIDRVEIEGNTINERSISLFDAWRRWLMPLAGTAMVALSAIGLAWLVSPSPSTGEMFAAEIENLSDEVGSYSFRAPGQNMFVVWVYDKGEAPAAESDLPPETSVQ